MIRVELWSAVSGERTEIARMLVSNRGKDSNPNFGDYDGHTLIGRSEAALRRSQDRGTYTRHGFVERHPKLKLHVWHLVAKMLVSMGYGPC